MVGRELTKVHQEFLRGTASEVCERLQTTVRGEFTVVVGPIGRTTEHVAAEAVASDETIAMEFGHIADSGAASRREAVRVTAQRLGVPPRQVYAAIERSKK